MISCIVIATDLRREMPAETFQSFLGSLPTKTPSQGVATLLVAALDPKFPGMSLICSQRFALHRGGYVADKV
jgi:hypothetical protein